MFIFFINFFTSLTLLLFPFIAPFLAAEITFLNCPLFLAAFLLFKFL